MGVVEKFRGLKDGGYSDQLQRLRHGRIGPFRRELTPFQAVVSDWRKRTDQEYKIASEHAGEEAWAQNRLSSYDARVPSLVQQEKRRLKRVESAYKEIAWEHALTDRICVAVNFAGDEGNSPQEREVAREDALDTVIEKTAIKKAVWEYKLRPFYAHIAPLTDDVAMDGVIVDNRWLHKYAPWLKELVDAQKVDNVAAFAVSLYRNLDKETVIDLAKNFPPWEPGQDYTEYKSQVLDSMQAITGLTDQECLAFVSSVLELLYIAESIRKKDTADYAPPLTIEYYKEIYGRPSYKRSDPFKNVPPNRSREALGEISERPLFLSDLMRVSMDAAGIVHYCKFGSARQDDEDKAMYQAELNQTVQSGKYDIKRRRQVEQGLVTALRDYLKANRQMPKNELGDVEFFIRDGADHIQSDKDEKDLLDQFSKKWPQIAQKIPDNTLQRAQSAAPAQPNANIVSSPDVGHWKVRADVIRQERAAAEAERNAAIRQAEEGRKLAHERKVQEDARKAEEEESLIRERLKAFDSLGVRNALEEINRTVWGGRGKIIPWAPKVTTGKLSWNFKNDWTKYGEVGLELRLEIPSYSPITERYSYEHKGPYLAFSNNISTGLSSSKVTGYHVHSLDKIVGVDREMEIKKSLKISLAYVPAHISQSTNVGETSPESLPDVYALNGHRLPEDLSSGSGSPFDASVAHKILDQILLQHAVDRDSPHDLDALREAAEKRRILIEINIGRFVDVRGSIHPQHEDLYPLVKL